MVRVVHGLLLIAAASSGGCAAPKSTAPSQPDALVAARALALEPAPSKASERATPPRAEAKLPDGAVRIELFHADARELARTLNELDEASFWAAESTRGCVLYKPPVEFLSVAHDDSDAASAFDGWRPISRDDPEIKRFIEESELQRLRDRLRDGPRRGPFQIEPPPPSFRAWDARTLVVLEAEREEQYLPRVRELVARLDQPAPLPSAR